MDILGEMFKFNDDIKQAKAADDKGKALRDYILEECKRQGFTVYEFEWLITALQKELIHRRDKVNEELF